MVAMPTWMPVLFALVAAAYASVGFAGGSSYVALCVLTGMPLATVPGVSLTCNMIVATGGVWHFARAGHLKARRLWPFLISSIPAAYWAGTFHLPKRLFCFVLGAALVAASVQLWRVATEKSLQPPDTRSLWGVGLLLGGGLGFLAGLVGIGGGIFLSPILMLLRWTTAKEAAAAAALFILLNSASALTAHLYQGNVHLPGLWPLALAVLLGGQLGSRMGAYRLPALFVRRGTSLLILYVAVRLLLEAR